MSLPTERKTGAAFPSPFKFKKYGQSGLEVSELFPNVGECADDICVIRSMHADVPNHEPSFLLMNCGEARQARPCMGSWVTYGLGTENQNLPGFIVMCPGGYPISETQNWQSAFLPGRLPGHLHRHAAHRTSNASSSTSATARSAPRPSATSSTCSASSTASTRRAGPARPTSRPASSRSSWPTGCRPRPSDAFDVTREPKHIREMYGPGAQARQLLIARRLLERGVRFVQVWHGAGQPWDNHDDLETEHRRLGRRVRPGRSPPCSRT